MPFMNGCKTYTVYIHSQFLEFITDISQTPPFSVTLQGGLIISSMVKMLIGHAELFCVEQSN